MSVAAAAAAAAVTLVPARSTVDTLAIAKDARAVRKQVAALARERAGLDEAEKSGGAERARLIERYKREHPDYARHLYRLDPTQIRCPPPDDEKEEDAVAAV